MKRLVISIAGALIVFFVTFGLGGSPIIGGVGAVIVYTCFFILFKPEKKEGLTALDSVKLMEGGLLADDSVHFYRDVYLVDLRTLKNEIQNEAVNSSIDEILLKANSILDFVIEHPAEYPEIRGFMDNYLPATIKIIKNYAGVQKSALEKKEKEEFENKLIPFLEEIETAFSKRLTELYDDKLTDSDIEMEALKKSLLMEGLLKNKDLEDFL